MPPRPIEPIEVFHPSIPHHLDGLTVLQIADLHVRRPQGDRSPIGELIDAVAQTQVDIVLLNGDFMHRPGQDDVAFSVLERLSTRLDARLGVFGVFGNHDSGAFQHRARQLDSIHWLLNQSVTPCPDLRIVGASFPEDFATAVLHDEQTTSEFVLGLSHYPNELLAASELGVDVLFAGHTHGGQWRLGKWLSPHTSCDLGWNQASGVIRYRQSLCVISRGLGEAVFEQRMTCPRHAPLVTLKRGPIPGPVDMKPTEIRRVVSW